MSNNFNNYQWPSRSPSQPPHKKGNRGCLIFIIIIIIMVGAGYIFLIIQPIRQTTTDSQQAPQIYGQLSEDQETAFVKLSDHSSRNLEVQEQGGSIRALSLDIDMGYTNQPELQVQAFMSAYQSLYKIKDFQNQFQLTEKTVTDLNTTILKFTQVNEAIPVFSSEMIFILNDSGRIVLINGAYLTDQQLDFDRNVTFGQEDIIEIARANGYICSSEIPEIEQVLFNRTVLGHREGNTELAWWMNAYSCEGDVELVFSALTGEVLFKAMLKNNFNFEIHQVKDNFNFIPCEWDFSCPDLLQSAKIIYSTSSEGNEGLDLKHENLRQDIEVTLQTYKDYFNWEGYDNNNSPFKVLVNVENAAFHWNKSVCKGVPVIVLDDQAISTARDVFTHEFQHAVTDFRVTLRQSEATAEAGALNEAYSDIFTALVDHETPWQIHKGNSLVRDMANPSSVRFSVDHYDDFLTKDSLRLRFWYILFDKPCFEHYSHQNSTIISHAAYLVAEGGSKRGISVEGLGIEDMARIFFDSQDYLVTNSTFMIARWATIQACEDFYAQNEFAEEKCSTVRNAFAIVGIGELIQQTTNLDRITDFLDNIIHDIIAQRLELLNQLNERILDMGYEVENFRTRLEQDLLNLLVDMLMTLIVKSLETLFYSTVENMCGSLLIVAVPVLCVPFLKKYL